MKHTLLTTFSSLILATTLNAQVAKWDHSGFDASGHTQFDCITPHNYTFQGVSRSNQPGSDGSSGGSNCFGYWNSNYESNYSERVEYKFSATSLLSAGGLKSVSFDIKKYSGGPKYFAYRLLKNNVQLFNTGATNSSSWMNVTRNLNLNFSANDEFKLQIQAYGLDASSSSNPRIALDNVTFHGEAKCEKIPEPSSTALIGLGGIALLLRRRK